MLSVCVGKTDPYHNAHLFYTKEIADFYFFPLTVVNYVGEGNVTYEISGARAEML